MSARNEIEEVEAELAVRIGEAAEELGVPEYDLTYNQLQKVLKTNGDKWLAENAAEVKRLGGFTSLRDAYFPRDLSDKEQLPVRAEKVKAVASQARKEVKLAAREQAFWNKFEELTEKLTSKAAPKQLKGSLKPAAKPGVITRELNILLSDLHFGSDLDPKYVPLPYGKVEEARRLAHVVKTVCNYKRDHRKETRLRVHLAGDIIQGQLHDARDGDKLASQCARAIHLLGQAMEVFAAEFPEVIVDCSTGNHDRNTARHKERATYEKSDSLATIIYYAVKKQCKSLKNVRFDITLKPYVTYDSFGAKCFGTHGDTVLNPGYPGNVINAKNLEMQINRINAALPNADEYKLFFVGHVHVGTVIHMGNGAILITNGALIPSDQYSVSIGLFENACGQSMWESVKDFVVGDYRFISVNGKTDKDASLDSIIEPFEDF